MQTRTAARLKRPAIDAEALYAALRLLSVDDGSAVARNRAARVLLLQLRALSSCTSVVLFSWSRALGARGDFEEAVEDAIQHAALVASTGSSRFRGRCPNEAVGWCRRILSNFLASEARRRARTVELFERERGASPAGMPPHLEASWRHAGQESALSLLRLEGRVRAHLERTRTRSASESLYRAVLRYLEYLAGQSEAARREPEPSLETSHPEAARRARDRQYQHHRRARRVLAELLEADAGSWDSNAVARSALHHPSSAAAERATDGISRMAKGTSTVRSRCAPPRRRPSK